MPLFVDGNISTIEDLRVYDSSILSVATIEQIDLAAKLKLSERELQVEIQSFLAREAARDGFQLSPSVIDLSRVVVTEPLHQWHSVHALTAIYRDAYYSQLNDRYQGRWKEFMRASASLQATLFETGLGIVCDPVPKAVVPTVLIDSGPIEASVYYIRASWINAAGQEGQASETTAVIADQFHDLEVAALNAPANATGWHIYIGHTSDTQVRQNASAILPGSTWSLPVSGLASGPRAGEGQSPDYLLRMGRILLRG